MNMGTYCITRVVKLKSTCCYRLKQQLQCKEQELKQLKQKYYTSTTEVKEDLIKQNHSLKQECLELKDKLKSYECQKEQQDYVELSDISKVINEVKDER